MGILKNTQKPTSQSTKTQTATNATIDIAQIRELIELMEEKIWQT